jgi:hypothetical protein
VGRQDEALDKASVTCNNPAMKRGSSTGKGANSSNSANSSKDRVRRYREAMRAQGYRTITLWIPDARRPGFAEECRRQSRLLRESAAEQKYLDALDLPEVEGWR